MLTDPRSLACAAALLACIPAAAFGMTITKGQSVTGQTGGTKTCDLVQWVDANGKNREVALVQATGDGGYKGGYVTRYTYYVGNDLKTGIAWDSSQQFVSGMGCIVDHYSDTAASSKAGSNASTGFLLEGDHHCIWQWQGTMNMGGTVAAKIYWVIADGRSDILWAVSYDCSGESAGTVQADARGPYFQFDWDGDNDFYGATISGIRWGDKYEFRTTTYNYENSSWDYSQPNVIPYMMLYKDGGLGDVECGVVQTQPWTVQDAGGYWWSGNWGSTGTGMPENWNCPYQLNAYEGYGGEKMAWGTNFGYVGSGAYEVLGGAETRSGHPHQGYAVSIVLNKYSEGLTDKVIDSYEAVQNTVLTASTGSIVTSGPDHAGLSGDVAYQPAGWDHVLSMWAATCSAGTAATVNMGVSSGSLVRPTFRFTGFTAGSLTDVLLNGTALTIGTDYYPSIDPSTDTLYLTLNRTISGATNTLSFGGGPAIDYPPSVSITAPAAGSAVAGTVTVTATATDDGNVASVDFTVDGSSRGSMTHVGGTTWTFAWDTSGEGEGDHDIAAVATDDADPAQQTTSANVTVDVANSGDSDGDGVSNLDEIALGTDINDPDSDNDGLDDGEEVALSTNPLQADTDGDGMRDGWEVDNGFSPTSAGDATGDADGDDHTNLQEYLAGTDPNDPTSMPALSTGTSGVSCAAGSGSGAALTFIALCCLAAAGLRRRFVCRPTAARV